MRTRAWHVVVASPWLVSSAAMADEFYVAPSVSLARVYDDNLFGAPDARRDRDLFWRLSPAVDVGERAERYAMLARYGVDAEWYRWHPELDATQARRAGLLEARLQSTPTFTWLGNASYTETERPGELNAESGVDAGRLRAQRLVVTPALAYRFDARRSLAASYSFTRDKLLGGVQTDTETTQLRVEEQTNERDSVNLACSFQRLVFDDQATTQAQVLTLGATRAFTPRTSATLQAGPRFSEGSTDAEVLAALRYELQPGELALNYARTHTTAIGLVGPVQSDAMGATLRWVSGRTLEIRGAPSVVRSTRGEFVARVFRFNLDLTYRWTPYWSFAGSYQYSLQHGTLDADAGDRITRNVVMIGVTLATPVRRDADTETANEPRLRTE
jgi:hypothetical protein